MLHKISPFPLMKHGGYWSRRRGAIPLHDAVFLSIKDAAFSVMLNNVLDVTSTKFYLSTTKSKKTCFLLDIVVLTPENRTSNAPRLSHTISE